MIHKNVDRWLFTLNGNVATTGGSANLAKGQFALVSKTEATINGAKVVSNLQGFPANKTLEMRLGKHNVGNRGARNSKAFSSIPFTLNDIKSISVSAPKTTEQKFDSYIVGYDGINDNTALTFVEGDTTVLDIILKGAPVGFYSDIAEHRIKLHFGYPEGETLTNQEIIQEAVRRLKLETLPRGNTKVTDLIDIDIVDSSSEDLTGIPYVFSTLVLNDSRDSNALADVQAQYPAYKVERTAVTGNNSTYTILHPESATLAAYTQTLASYIKECEDCLAGYDEIESGFVYSVSIEDDGADATTTVDNVPGFVTGSVVKVGQKDGVGVYTVVTNDALTDAEIAAYVATAGMQSTAVIVPLGEVKAMCYDDTVTSTPWVAGETCYATTQGYTIQLADDDCDGSRLAELQAAYPNLVIEAGAATGAATQAITISGGAGDMSLVIAGTTYTTPYVTSPTATAAAFVAAHAAAILDDTGAAVTSNAAVITVAHDAEEFPEIEAVAGGLTETIAPIDYVTVATTGGCQRVYSTTVTTNIVCDECDPMFLGQFFSEAPRAFDFVEWQPVVEEADATAKMGIRITGKPFILDPGEEMFDDVPFYETSVEIIAAGGYVEDYMHSEQNYIKPFSVKRISRKEDRDHLGYEFKRLEDQSRTYFDGERRHKGNLFAKAALGEESVLENRKQYVHYEISIDDTHKAQGNGGRVDTGINYQVVCAVGAHQRVEDLINEICGRANLPAVQAFANN